MIHWCWKFNIVWLFTVIYFPPFIYIFTKMLPSGKKINSYSFIGENLKRDC